MNTNTIAPPDLGKLNELAKLHALSYASPHHFTMSVNGLREIFAALQLPAGNTIALDALRPFAKLLEQAVAAGKQDATNVDCQIAVSDMRRAVAAIAALEQAEEPFGWVSRGDDGSVMLELNGDQRIDDGDAVYRAKPFAALEAEPQPEADMFWDGDDPEIFGHDIQELAAERGPGQVFSVDRAMRLPSIKVRVIAGETEDDENTWEEILPTPPKD